MDSTSHHRWTRRNFVQATSAFAAAGFAADALAVSRTAQAAGSATLRVGVIGCGGRGTGAAYNALEASTQTRIVALADVFQDRVDGARGRLANDHADRATVADDHCFVGFNGYRQLLDHADVDMVILATPPHFRPFQLEYAVARGKHVFMEKPVAVDPAGVRKVISAGEAADRQGLSIVSGTQRRHEACYLALMERIHGGELGEVISARCWWNQGGLWVVERTPEMSDMEWQLRNWLYFAWLSGDHIVEQHIHNLDVMNWAMNAHPVKCLGMGGRQVRTDPKYGHIFDHFAIEYEYPDGRFGTSQCRQIDGCAGRVAEAIHCTKARSWSSSNHATISGGVKWRFSDRNPNPYVQEHIDLIASINGDSPRLNEARRVAESTLTAIMGRLSAYTGQEVTWEQALNSTLDLSPPVYEFGPLPTPEVAVPGRTKLT